MSRTAPHHVARVAQKPTNEGSGARRSAAPQHLRPAVPPRSLRPPRYGIEMIDERAPGDPALGAQALAGGSIAGAVPGARAVQARAGDLSGPDVFATADRGVAGAGAQLPHVEIIQRSFGRHDLRGVRAQVGGAAAEASRALGAEAYATGDRVAFASTPDLRTAAHEAAHVVQQAGGVQLKDGVGEAGDRYEQHADAVAEAVVAGRSAEALLDAFAPPGVPASAGAATQRKAVQRLASDYKSATEIRAMTLTQFDAYARAQADWAISAELGEDKELLRDLLAFARHDGGLVLGACGGFFVNGMLNYGAYGAGGSPAVSEALTDYSRAASVGKNAGTIHIEQPTTSLMAAWNWGEAIGKLEEGIGGPIIERTIPQSSQKPCLDKLSKGDLADQFVAYFKIAGPLLDATNGAEITSYLEFHSEGGQEKIASYRESLPEIRNLHRFTVQQLDLLADNRVAAQNNRSRPVPLPICVVLQSALDHNGVFHRNPHLTALIERTGIITLVAEGKPSLDELRTALATFATFGPGGKVDEILVAGHGDAKRMELAGDRDVNLGNDGTRSYGFTRKEDLTVEAGVDPAHRDRETEKLVGTIKEVLRDDPSARVVLNACLTGSNTVNDVTLDKNSAEAAAQIRAAIAAKPGLATAVRTMLGAHQAQVRGANASFSRTRMLDAGGKIDLVSTRDPMLTATKLEYVEHGIEPVGVLRATLESWANDRPATIAALTRRIAAKSASTSWSDRVIVALVRFIVKHPDSALQLRVLTNKTVGALAHLLQLPECRVSTLKGCVPSTHMEEIFTYLTGSTEWNDHKHIPLVVYQVWIEHFPARIADFLAFLDASAFNTQNADAFLDLGQMAPMIDSLLPLPPTTPPPRGPFLIALHFLVKQRAGAPQRCKDYIQAVVGAGNLDFPATCNVGDILKGAPQPRVLEDAGVVAAGAGAVPAAPAFNLAPTGTGPNVLHVEPVTRKGKLKNWMTRAHMPSRGKWIDVLLRRPMTERIVHVIGVTTGRLGGKTEVPLYAIEHSAGGYRTVFVRASEIALLEGPP